jgi:hypothetical protein
MDLAGVIVPSKIKIKMGSFELEYEVEDAVSKDDVLDMVTKLAEILPQAILDDPAESGESGEGTDTGKAPNGQWSTSTIAQKLNLKTGSGLAKAALARLTIYGGKDSVKRGELLAEMQTAKSFYKATFANNLSGYLKTLVSDGTFLDHGSDTYALGETSRAAIKQSLNGQS